MCQAKPLPRCSSHAPGLVQAAEYKYQVAKAALEKQRAKVEVLTNGLRSKGFSDEALAKAKDPALSRLAASRAKLRQCIDESNERLRDIWESELHYDATKIGFKAITSNPALGNRDERTNNAIALREWHKRLRSIRGNNGKSLFDRDGDVWMRNAVLEEEYTIASRKYKEQAFQYNAINGEIRKMKSRFEDLTQKASKTSEDYKEIERLKQHASAMRDQQNKIHYAMILERAKKNLIETSVTDEFKHALDSKELVAK